METKRSIPYIVLEDLYARDEWGNKKLLAEKDQHIYGNEVGEYIVSRRYHIPKKCVKNTNTLKCDHCDRNDAWNGHMNTRYEDEESNYVTLCQDCWEECDAYWEERWAEYYSNCM